MRVQDVMCRPVVSCTEETSLASAARSMAQNDCGVLPVLRGGRIVGMLSDRDVCLAAGRGKSMVDTTAKTAMQENVVACEVNEELRSALEKMATRQVRRLPVLDAKGKLVGIVSLDDLALWAEEPAPAAAPPALSCRDLANAFRQIVAKRPLRKPA